MTAKIDPAAVLAAFGAIADAKDWHRHHTPRNLASAVAVEAGELLREFQWLAEGDTGLSTALKERVGSEVADVLIYLLVLCDKLELEPAEVVAAKQAYNRRRFLGEGVAQ